jgi:hypothetical protein
MTVDKHNPEHITAIAGKIGSSDRLALSEDRLRVAFLFPFNYHDDGSQAADLLVTHLSTEGKLRLVAANKPVPKHRIFAYLQGLAGVWSQTQKAEVLLVRLRGLSDLLTHWFPVLVAAKINHRRVVGLFEFSSNLWQQPFLSRIVYDLLRGADGLVSPTEWQAAALHRIGLRATVIPPVQSAAVGAPFSSVQPHIGLWLSKESRTELGRILQSFHLVKQKYPRAELTIFAAGNLTEFIESAISESGMHLGAGVHHDIIDRPTQLQQWDTAICLGADSAFPADLLAAWRVGAPVLVPAYSLVSSMVRDRYNGLIYSSYGAGSLADTIVELIENPSLVQQLSTQGLKESDAFDWPALRQRWWSVLASPSM